MRRPSGRGVAAAARRAKVGSQRGARSTARSPDAERGRRVRHLIAVDADALMRRLAKRQGEMVELFSRRRDRSVLLRVVTSWLPGAGFAELAELSPLEQLATSAFCEALEELRWYLEHTEDMPQTLVVRMGPLVRGLEARHAALVAALGPPDGIAGAVVEVPVRRAGGLRVSGGAAGAGAGRRGE